MTEDQFKLMILTLKDMQIAICTTNAILSDIKNKIEIIDGRVEDCNSNLCSIGKNTW